MTNSDCCMYIYKVFLVVVNPRPPKRQWKHVCKHLYFFQISWSWGGSMWEMMWNEMNIWLILASLQSPTVWQTQVKLATSTEMLMSSLIFDEHSNPMQCTWHISAGSVHGCFHQHFCFRSMLIIDTDSWPNFIPLSKLCSESTISAAESRCSCRLFKRRSSLKKTLEKYCWLLPNSAKKQYTYIYIYYTF